MLLSSNELDMLILQHGKDGTSADSKYIWVKYAQDKNGTGLTDDPTNAVYIGIAYNKTEKHESDNPNDYTWTRIKGNDGESAYTVILQNENITFSVSNQNNIALMDQSFDTSVVVFKGTDAVSNFTIGTVESKNGISVTQKNNTITFSVDAGNKIEADYGKFSIPISVNGLVFKKEVSWSLAKAGAVGGQGNPGEPALSISLGNESQNIPCTYDGHVINDMLIEISFVGYRGLTRTPCNVAVGTLPSGMTLGSTENCTISNDGSIILNIVKNATLGTESTLTGNIVLTFSINGKTLVKNFTWAKSKDGGLSYIYSIEPSSYVINKTYDGTLSPASITFNAYYQKDGSDRIPYRGLFTIEESTTGSDFKSTYLSSKNESSLTYTPTSNNIKSVRCTLSQTDKVSVVLDRQTVIVLSDDKMKDALTTVTTRVNGVSSKVDGIDKKITNKVWQTDITTAVNNYDGTTVKSLRDQVSSQETKIGEITSEVSDVKTTVKNNQTSVQKDIASIKQDATGFKQTVASTYETKNDATSKYSSFDQRAGKIETNVKTLQGNVTTLSQTDTEIKAELKTAKGDITTLKSDASGLSTKITNAQGDVNILKADAKTMKTRISNAEGDISTLQQTANGFQVQLSKKADQVDSFNAAKTATNFMQFTDGTGLEVGNKTSGSWSGYRTKISASAFEILNRAGTTLAYYGDKLIQLGKNAKDAVIELCGGVGKILVETKSGNAALSIQSEYVDIKGVHESVLETSSSSGSCIAGAVDDSFVVNTYSDANNKANFDIGNGSIILESKKKGYQAEVEFYGCGWSGGVYTGAFAPTKAYSEKIMLGDSGRVWERLIVKNSPQVTSDRRAKTNIFPLGESKINKTDIHSELFDRLKPVQYRMIDGDGRICYGFVAQDVVEAMRELGIREDELDLVHHDRKNTEDGYTDTYSMVYTNLIAVITHELQLEKQRRSNLELEVADLRSELETMRDNLSGNTN